MNHWEVHEMVVILRAPIHRSIKLQTRKGNCVENSQDCDYSPSQKIAVYRESYRAAIPRNKPNPFYNCHGMTFASARTWVFPKDIKMIIDDDGYTVIKSIDKVLPGDIIIYYNAKAEIMHSGIVISRAVDGEFNYPWVVSKWGHLSEYVHLAYDCPYLNFDPPIKYTYWRVTK